MVCVAICCGRNQGSVGATATGHAKVVTDGFDRVLCVLERDLCRDDVQDAWWQVLVDAQPRVVLQELASIC